MAIIRPSQLPPGASANPSGSIPIDQGTNVEKVTPKQVVDAGVPLASQVDAEAGNSNDDRMSSLRVKQAIDAQAATIDAVNNLKPFTTLSAFKAQPVANNQSTLITVDGGVDYTWMAGDFSSITPDDDVYIKADDEPLTEGVWKKQGAETVVTQRSETGSVPQTLFEIMTKVITPSPLSFGGKGDGTDDTSAILETIKRTGRTFLPHGTWLCDAEALVSPTLNPNLNGLFISGEGRESVLQFDDGGLFLSGRISRNSRLQNFRINLTGSNSTALTYEDISVSNAPTRINLDNVELSSVTALGNTGLKLQGGWIGTYNNPIIRGFGGAGVLIERSSDGPEVSWNGLNIVGGEIQGNGTGVDMEGALNVNFFGTAIEGNRGTGALLRDTSRSISFYGVYFEANGIDNPTTTNDIRIEASNGLSSIYSVLVDNGCTFLRGGVGSDTAIWVNRCQGLFIQEGAAFNGYDTLLNIQQLGANLVSGAMRARSIGNQIPVINNSNSFGDPQSLVSSMAQFEMPANTNTTSAEVYIDLPEKAANTGTITINFTSGGSGDVQFLIQPYDLATGNSIATVASIPTVTPGRNSVSINITYSSRNMKGKKSVIRFQRQGASGSDTLAESITIESMEVSWRA